jgi:dTDP-4-amino-4,6-dideoxygalactose transaminase
MNVPFFKPSITQAEIDEVIDSLKSGWLTTGPKTKRFEQEFAAYVGQKHAVALNSCTAALHLALEAVGLKAGQTVVVPTMTFAATAEVVRYFDAKPLLVDCQKDDFNLDVNDADRRIEQARARGEKVVAIVPVHYGGQIVDVAGVTTLARKYNLKVIEDAAHCCPAYYRNEKAEIGKQKSERNSTPHTTLSPVEAARVEDGGRRTEDGGQKTENRGQAADSPASTLNPQPSTLRRVFDEGGSALNRSQWLPVGSVTDITCYSFYANKCITTGEGGMACTQNDEFAERMRIMSLHGISKDAWKRFTAEGSWYYEIVAPGFKYNLTDIAAAIGIHQLCRADEMHRKRTQLAKRYTELLADVEELTLPRRMPNRIHSWHLYVVRLKLDRLKIDRSGVIDALKLAGITTSVHWLPLHMHPYYREKYGYAPEDLPVAANLYPEVITLPLFPDMTEEQVTYVSDTLKSVIAQNLMLRPHHSQSSPSNLTTLLPAPCANASSIYASQVGAW